jgi:hypothetical protein
MSRRKQQRGQATVEYALVTWLLIVGLVLGCTVRILPGPKRQENLIQLLLGAYQVYYDSFYWLLNAPFP